MRNESLLLMKAYTEKSYFVLFHLHSTLAYSKGKKFLNLNLINCPLKLMGERKGSLRQVRSSPCDCLGLSWLPINHVFFIIVFHSTPKSIPNSLLPSVFCYYAEEGKERNLLFVNHALFTYPKSKGGVTCLCGKQLL